MYPHFTIMKSGRQPVHSSLRCRSSAVSLFWGIAPAFPPFYISGALPQLFRPFTFLGHCPSFSAHSHFWVIAPALLHSSVSGALPQLFCPFTFLGHCPSSSSLSRFWGNSTHAKKSEVLTSNASMYISETESTGDFFLGDPRPRSSEKETPLYMSRSYR